MNHSRAIVTPALRRQRGVTMTGLLIAAVIVGSVLTLGFRLGPHYFEFAQVKSAMDRMRENPPSVVVPRALIDHLDNQLYIDNVKGVNRKDFKLHATPEGYEVNLAYEAREPVIGNVHAVMVFSHKVLVRRQ